MENLAVFAALPFLVIISSMILGLLWAPFAAFICAVIARVRGLSSSYAGTGAWYSMLFILPWFYLALRMLGVRVPQGLVRIGYTTFYGAWLYAAVAITATGPGSILFQAEEFRIGDAVMLTSGGLFIGCVWFISLRQLLRRNEAATSIEPSTPIRAAYAALHALWLLFAAGVFLAGLFESEVKDKDWAATPLYLFAAAMAIGWIFAMFRFRLNKADKWDYPGGAQPDLLLPDSLYIQPFIHLYLLIVIPAIAGIMLFFVMLISWAG